MMPPRPPRLPRHVARLGALAALELSDPGLGAGQPRAELRHQPLEVGHGLLEVAELAAGGAGGGGPGALRQVAVLSRHQPGVLEITLKVDNHYCSKRLINDLKVLSSPCSLPLLRDLNTF